MQGSAAPSAAKGADEAGGSGALSKAALVGLAQPGIARLVIDEEGPEPIAEVSMRAWLCNQQARSSW